MRPKQPTTMQSGDLFRARLEQIINMKHEPVHLASTRPLGGDVGACELKRDADSRHHPVQLITASFAGHSIDQQSPSER